VVLSGVSFQSAYLVSRFRFSHAIGQIGTGAGLSWQETKLTSLSLPPTMPHTLCLSPCLADETVSRLQWYGLLSMDTAPSNPVAYRTLNAWSLGL